MTCISPKERESLRLQQKIVTVIDYIGDHFKAWLFGWIIIVGGICLLMGEDKLMMYLVTMPVFCLLGLAVLVGALAMVCRILRL